MYIPAVRSVGDHHKIAGEKSGAQGKIRVRLYPADRILLFFNLAEQCRRAIADKAACGKQHRVDNCSKNPADHKPDSVSLHIMCCSLGLGVCHDLFERRTAGVYIPAVRSVGDHHKIAIKRSIKLSRRTKYWQYYYIIL